MISAVDKRKITEHIHTFPNLMYDDNSHYELGRDFKESG